MKETTHYYQCDACQSGTVRVRERETRSAITLDVFDCDQCKKEFGIKRASGLKLKQIDEISPFKFRMEFPLRSVPMPKTLLSLNVEDQFIEEERLRKFKELLEGDWI